MSSDQLTNVSMVEGREIDKCTFDQCGLRVDQASPLGFSSDRSLLKSQSRSLPRKQNISDLEPHSFS